MWFKNLQVFSFTDAFQFTAEQVNERLAAHEFAPITQMQESSFGWVPSFRDSSLFCEQVSGRLFFTAQIQDKILPASVVNDHLTEKLDLIELDEGRRPGRKEREQLKEDIRAQLLPKAFNKTRRLSAWIDPAKGWLIINASSDKSADDFTAHLREALGTLQVIPFAKSTSGSELLTGWFLDATTRPVDTELEAELELTMVQDPTVKARFKNLDLGSPEIQQALDSGMRIRQMAMNLIDHCQFVINEKLQIKRIKYQEALLEKANDMEDPRSDALLMSDTVSQLLMLIEPYTRDDSV